MNMVSAGLPRNTLYVVLKSATSNYMYYVRKFFRVLKVTGRVIWPMGVTDSPGTIPWKGARLGCSANLYNPIWWKVIKNRIFRELPPSTRTQLSLTSLTMRLTIKGYRPGFGIKSGWSLRLKVMGTLDHFRYSRVVGGTTMTSRVVSFCFLLDS
jgi:hypothetical protein